MITSVLSFIILVGWTLFTFWFLVAVVRTWRRHGMKAAFRRLAFRELLSYRIVLPFVILASLTLVKASLQFVYPHQIGVVVSVLNKNGIRDEPVTAGLHWIVPLAEHVVLYPVFWQTYTMSSHPFEGDKALSDAITSRTLDSQEVTMDISVIFRIDPEQVVMLHKFWQSRYKQELLRPSVRAFMRRQVSQFTVDQVNSDKRTELETLLDQDLKVIGKRNGLIVKDVLLRNIAFSSEYAAAVEYKQVAFQQELAKLHEAKQIENLARGKASKITIVAKAEADAIRIKAEAKAAARLIHAKAEARALDLIGQALKNKENLLTYRYIDRLSPNIQAVVLPNDMPLIFPLPDMNTDKLPKPAAEPESPGRTDAETVAVDSR